MKIRDKLDWVYRELDQEEKAEQYRQDCEYYLIALEKTKRKDCSDENFLNTWIDAGEDYRIADKPESAIRCYEFAKRKWCQLHNEKKTTALYLLSRIYQRWFDLENEIGNIEHCRELLKEWYEEIWKYDKDHIVDRTELSNEIKKISDNAAFISENEMAIRCYLEAGILQLENNTENIPEGYLPICMLEETFFISVKQNLSSKQIDLILIICDNILSLSLEKTEYSLLKESCRDTIYYLRESRISFK